MNGSGYWLPAELPFVDGIEVTGPNQNPAINGPELLRIISKFINMVPPLEAASLSSTSVQKSEQILHQMSQAVADITQQAAVVLSDVERRRIEIEGQLDVKFAKKQEALDVEHAERLRALTERESELNLKLQELDNSDNTHSRRALAARMRGFIFQYSQTGIVRKFKQRLLHTGWLRTHFFYRNRYFCIYECLVVI